MPGQHYTCVFSHLILSGRCACQMSAKDCFAEKEFGACMDETGAQRCQSLYNQLKDNSHFAIDAIGQSRLSVGQQAKIKMGGLLALQEILHQQPNASIADINNLVLEIKAHYQDFSKIPFSQLMPVIAKFKFRIKP